MPVHAPHIAARAFKPVMANGSAFLCTLRVTETALGALGAS